MKLKKISFLVGALLASQSAMAASNPEIEELRQQINALAQQVEDSKSSSKSNTSIGGYGELHYNNLKTTQPGQAGTEKKEIDFHRFVLFFGHEFNDKIRFFSEVEIEHALSKDTSDGSNGGEVEVEQAYVELDLNNQLSTKAGVILVPVGILNETHEPPTFYGVERNPVEKNIIPATWWSGGLTLNGRSQSGFSYDLMLSEGLYSADGYSIRDGRQKTSKAKANDLAYTGRIKYTGVPGLELAATARYESDLGQGTLASKAPATLLETHAIYTIDQFTIKGLYAQWDISGDAAKAADADKQSGYYIEPSYKLTEKWGVFTRYNNWKKASGSANDETQTDIGVNYWPHPDVVFKADYQWYTKDDKKTNGFNLGVGYQF
ncbi:porin [Hydrogenovibrio sp. 3SP14C1]|uniref:porin n=1 Tax=Hydrogenovibrio sp. 3SP14C1 TaxID=3038774 RepID=UPI0024173104|nr:porin [Hydrogenovibrio sp. 3SP14C1]MDG4812877.1 porin [Hydrogenovibrio sp. 3SP14C1]